MNKLQLKQIISDQQEELKQEYKGKIVIREIEDKISQSLKNNLIKVIAGVRRCGKSFLARQILAGKESGYVNFDDERLVGIKTRDLNDILEIFKEIKPHFEYLFFDEIQNVDSWELYINRLKRLGYNIIITGSNSKLLSRELATHLTGRHILFELFPFSFQEYLNYYKLEFSKEDFYLTQKRAQIKKMLERYLRDGGFPEIERMEFPEQYLNDLYSKIITRDIVLRYNINHLKSLKEIALYLFSNFGSKITYHKLKNIFEMKSVHTVKNYMDYLEEAYLTFQLYPFSHKFKEIVKGARKIYCIDTGIINLLSVSLSANKGRIMENIVFLELKRRGKEIYFYINSSGGEVDFIVKEKTKIKELIQVCFNIDDFDTKKREIKSLIKTSVELKCRNLTVITWDKECEEKISKEKIRYIPLYQWLLKQDK